MITDAWCAKVFGPLFPFLSLYLSLSLSLHFCAKAPVGDSESSSWWSGHIRDSAVALCGYVPTLAVACDHGRICCCRGRGDDKKVLHNSYCSLRVYRRGLLQHSGLGTQRLVFLQKLPCTASSHISAGIHTFIHAVGRNLSVFSLKNIHCWPNS